MNDVVKHVECDSVSMTYSKKKGFLHREMIVPYMFGQFSEECMIDLFWE